MCDDEGEADQREKRREAAEAETLRGGSTRWMLKMREGIKKRKSRDTRERETRERRRNKCSGEKEKGGREKEKKNTVRVMCVGVVLHAYKPAAYLALLFPQKKCREESRQMLSYVRSL